MNQEDRLRLRRNRLTIIKDLDVKDVLDHLYCKEIINEDDKDIIKSKDTRTARCQELLDRLPIRGPNAYAIFKEALEERYDWLIKDLDDTDVSSIPSAGNAAGPVTELGHRAFKVVADNPQVLMGWKDLGRELGLKEAELAELEYANNRSLKEQCYQMLVAWKNKQGSSATVDVLKEILSDNGYMMVVDRLDGKYT